jgi:hypothetical protein
MDTREVAMHLNVSPRELRKFLRADPEFVNAGCGGKYTFELKDMPRLKKRYTAYKNGDLKKLAPIIKKTTPRTNAQADLIVESGLPITILHVRKISSTLRRQRDSINAAREARLIEQLKACGL